QIDGIDRQIVTLLNQRLALAAEIGKLKRSQGGQIYVAEREEAVLNKVTTQNAGPIRNEALKAIYREIMSAAIALEKPLLIAYLGPEATNTHQAATKKFGASVDYHAMPTVGDIFTAVEKGEADYAVIPIENSTEGSVRDALDLFVESDLKIVAQIYLEIAHALISNSPLEEITKVYSKDQALAQCRHWLQRHLSHAQQVDCASTARAVQIAKEEKGAAAVAGELAAAAYGVPVVAKNIQDKMDNTTRFFVLGKKPSGRVGDGKDLTSFVISLGDQASAHAGALLKMLMPFANRGINLSKIESRPSKRRPWDYNFFIDVTGHYEDPAMKEAMAELQKFCPVVKWLGSYPAAG
ncbi:MAG TPA: prephenate dehydratase, partial [Opitutus sp.]|nr:prephenate dehydratase [Opitutus sp.]